ncbi:Mycofactocin [Actinobacteria bacterium OK074]|nr:Mycofactocin [Actinobacteria bacterium OK074]
MNELHTSRSAESGAVEAGTAEEDVTVGALIQDEDLLEDVSIDGMCGVY